MKITRSSARRGIVLLIGKWFANCWRACRTGNRLSDNGAVYGRRSAGCNRWNVTQGHDGLAGSTGVYRFRKVRKGDLFVALKGARFDGHRFLDEVFTRGAKGVVLEAFPRRAKVDKLVPARSVPFVVKVADSLRAYQDLATFHRARFDIPVVAVTGSNGKTTTKEMVAKTLSQRWRLRKTAGNLNNRIGLPHTVLGLTAAHQAAVLELGVDAEGQTTRLAEIARPTIGLITNVGSDHLEFFGSVERSARAKAELLARLPRDGTVVLNADDPYYEFFRRRARCAVVSFGLREQADVRGSQIQRQGIRTEFRLHVAGRQRSHRLSLHVHGTHNVLNALAAIAVGHVLGLSVANMATRLESISSCGHAVSSLLLAGHPRH